jgi:release factor glutamine methyltransferase
MRGTPARDALDGAITAIAAAGCETPRLDAEVLLAHVLGVARERLLIDQDLVVEGPAVRAYQDAVRGVRWSASRSPTSSGTAASAVSIWPSTAARSCRGPRPSCWSRSVSRSAGARVLDVGTGSGAVALALKDERPTCRSAQRPQRGLARAGTSEREALGPGRAVAARGPARGHPRRVRRGALEPSVCRRARSGEAGSRDPPPRAARRPVRGADGLAAIRALLALCPSAAGCAVVALEVGAGQAPAGHRADGCGGFPSVRAERDLAGIERVVVGERDR